MGGFKDQHGSEYHCHAAQNRYEQKLETGDDRFFSQIMDNQHRGRDGKKLKEKQQAKKIAGEIYSQHSEERQKHGNVKNGFAVLDVFYRVQGCHQPHKACYQAQINSKDIGSDTYRKRHSDFNYYCGGFDAERIQLVNPRETEKNKHNRQPLRKFLPLSGGKNSNRAR
jgi:hypothetical protein